MFHPSRILIILSLLFLIFVALSSPHNLPEKIISVKNPMLIVSEPRALEHGQLFLVRPKGSEFLIQVWASKFPSYAYGDWLNIEGDLTPLHQSKYVQENKGYFLAQNIYYEIRNPKIELTGNNTNTIYDFFIEVRKKLISVRENMVLAIKRSLPEPQASLLAGILLGVRGEIPTEVKNDLTKVGLIHIIALSGYNITIIAEAIRVFFRRFSKRLSFWGSLIAIWLFVLSTGLSPSIIRAAIMGTILLIAGHIGRKSSGLVAVLVASVIMVLESPNILLYDIGFQLSFAAVFGIIFLAPRINRYFEIFGKPFGEILATTLSAQLFTFALISFYFERISLFSVFSNLLVLPVIPVLMLFGFLGALFYFVFSWFSIFIFEIAWFILTYIIKIAEYFSAFSYAELNFGIKFLELILIYILLAIFILFLKKKDLNEKRSL